MMEGIDWLTAPLPTVRAKVGDETRWAPGVSAPPKARIPRPVAGPQPSAEAGRTRSFTCRALNVVVAVILLVATLPLMILVALAVRLTSRGPVIFVQPRVGLDRRRSDSGSSTRRTDLGGRIFRIYKFRTMRVESASSEQVWAGDNDPRVTPVGRFLRLYRLDELPQLVNVLKGDMNVVGPRPEQPRLFRKLREEVENYEMRQQVLPGITGWAQINNGYDRSVEDVRRKLRLDLEYLQRRSPMEDLRIMIRTAPVMIFKQGAQ